MLTHPSSSDDRPVFADVLATPIRHPVNPRAALPTPVWEVHSTSPMKLILRIQPPLKSHPVLFHVSTPQSRIETRSDAGADTRSHGHIINFQVAMSRGRDQNLRSPIPQTHLIRNGTAASGRGRDKGGATTPLHHSTTVDSIATTLRRLSRRCAGSLVLRGLARLCHPPALRGLAHRLCHSTGPCYSRCQLTD